MNRVLKILLFSSGFYFLAAGLFGPLYAIYVEEIGGGLVTAGAAYSAFCIAAGVLIFLISKWEDHVEHKEKLVIAGSALDCLGFAGYLMVQTPIDLVVVEIIFGIAVAVRAPVFDGVYSQHLDSEKYVSDWGIWESMSWIVTGASAAVGGIIANIYGFRVLFTFMFIASLISFLISILLLVQPGSFRMYCKSFAKKYLRH